LKFKDKHRHDILNLIQDHELDKSHFSFVKRKGRIIIKHFSGSSFSFFMKDDFDIDVKTMQRIDLSYFEVKPDTNEIIKADNWESVLALLSKWLLRT